MREPQTPRELRDAFLRCFDEVDTVVIEAVDELVERLELAYCGKAELTKIEFLFARTLYQMMMMELESYSGMYVSKADLANELF